MTHKKTVIAVGGVTCAGKSTLMQALAQMPHFGTIEVGKEMRKRYPPEFFKGKAAMKETEEEVWQIFDEQYKKHLRDPDCAAIFSDGQPRLPSQVYRMYNMIGPYNFIMMHASRERLERRARQRSTDQGNLDLALARITNDNAQLYEVLLEYHHLQIGRARTLYTDNLNTEEAKVEFLKLVYDLHPWVLTYGSRNGKA